MNNMVYLVQHYSATLRGGFSQGFIWNADTTDVFCITSCALDLSDTFGLQILRARTTPDNSSGAINLLENWCIASIAPIVPSDPRKEEKYGSGSLSQK